MSILYPLHPLHTLIHSDATPKNMNARSRVHEYGGGQTVAVGNTGDTITSDFTTNALMYTQTNAAAAQSDCGQSETSVALKTLTDMDKPYRYADMILDPCLASKRGNKSRLLVAVREDHTIDVPAQVVNNIVALSIDEASEVSLELNTFFFDVV